MNKTATFVKDLSNFTGDARLYKVTPPCLYEGNKRTSYLIVSAACAFSSGPETYIFPGNKKGKVIDWGELPGSFRGSFDHEKALRDAGYEVAP